MTDVIKAIHMTSAALAISGFVLRGVWMIKDSPLLKTKLAKTLPHLIDTVLLVSAVALAIEIEQYPFVHGWLTAKIVGLVLYILLGFVAFRFGRTKPQKIAAWAGAIVMFAYVVSVAITHDPRGFFGLSIN